MDYAGWPTPDELGQLAYASGRAAKVGRRLWEAGGKGRLTSLLAILRTIKSDVVVGIMNEKLGTLEATGEAWRTNGTRAMIQARA